MRAIGNGKKVWDMNRQWLKQDFTPNKCPQSKFSDPFCAEFHLSFFTNNLSDILFVYKCF